MPPERGGFINLVSRNWLFLKFLSILKIFQFSYMSRSNSEFGLFPDDVIMQIFARLPVKSIPKIKCVCKLWRRLVSESYFKQLCNEISVKNSMVLVDFKEASFKSWTGLICVDKLRCVSEFSLDFIKDRVTVRASCNGLLCCSSVWEKGVYYVCNPVTREYYLLPISRESPINIFGPDGEATLVGLGCNLLTQSYHVLLAGYHRPVGQVADGTFVSYVYDSESNQWSKFVSSQDVQFSRLNSNQVVFVNEQLHWLAQNCSCVFVFDLKLKCEGKEKENKLWRKILLPDELSSGFGNSVYLLELEGCLSVIQMSDTWMNIWVMKEKEKEKDKDKEEEKEKEEEEEKEKEKEEEEEVKEKEGGEGEEWELVDRVSLRCISGMMPGIFPISQTHEYVFLATHRQILAYQRKNRVWKEMYSVNSSPMMPFFLLAHSFRSTSFPCHPRQPLPPPPPPLPSSSSSVE